MLRYIFRRVLFLIPVLVGVAFCVFLLLYLTPGDPAKMVLGDLATEQAIQEFREKEGLNDPFWIRFGKYLGAWWNKPAKEEKDYNLSIPKSALAANPNLTK